MQPERADLTLENPRVKRLAPPGTRLRDGHRFSLPCGSAEAHASALKRFRRSEKLRESASRAMAHTLFLRFAQVRGLADATRSGGQGRGRTTEWHDRHMPVAHGGRFGDRQLAGGWAPRSRGVWLMTPARNAPVGPRSTSGSGSPGGPLPAGPQPARPEASRTRRSRPALPGPRSDRSDQLKAHARHCRAGQPGADRPDRPLLLPAPLADPAHLAGRGRLPDHPVDLLRRTRPGQLHRQRPRAGPAQHRW